MSPYYYLIVQLSNLISFFFFIGQVSGEDGGVQVLRTRREAQGIW